MTGFWSGLFQSSSFLGSLFGALITGGLALYINSFQHRKLKQKEDYESKRVLLVFHHYSKEILKATGNINKNYEKYGLVYDPYSEIEDYIDRYGNEQSANFPSEYERKEYDNRVKPYINSIKQDCEFILNAYEKISAIDIYSLKIKELDKVLNFLNHFNQIIKPELNDILKSEYPYISLQKREVIIRIVESFYYATKIK